MDIIVGQVCTEHTKVITQQAVDCWNKLRDIYGSSNLWDTCICLADERYNSRFYRKTLDAQLVDDKLANIEMERVALKTQEVVRKQVKECDDSRWYLITFTNKPTEFDPLDLLKRTKKVISSKQVSPIQWAYSLEIQPGTGTPHTHILIESNKYFDYTKVKNFNGGRVADIRKEKWNIKNYIIKDETKPSKEYLEKYGINQWFWCSDDYAGPKPGETSELPSNTISWA